MYPKEDFVKTIDRLMKTNDLQEQIDELIRDSDDDMIRNFMNSAGFIVTHEDIIVSLLEYIMNDRFGDISYFIYEMDYGRKFELGNVKDAHGNNIDLGTAEKLYDYLIENSSNGKTDL